VRDTSSGVIKKKKVKGRNTERAVRHSTASTILASVKMSRIDLRPGGGRMETAEGGRDREYWGLGNMEGSTEKNDKTEHRKNKGKRSIAK